MTTIEAVGIFLYVKNWNNGELAVVFKTLMIISILPASWFQLTLLKWCIFVKKYVDIRERRVRNLLLRLDQEEALNITRANQPGP